jgi:hypothetical protein
MFLLNGKPLPIDTPFETGGIRYPANWLRLSTAKEKTAIGITEIAEQLRPDDRFYWVTDNGDGTYTAIAKAVPDVQKMLIDQIDGYAYTTLFRTDWMVVRKAEVGDPIDPAISAYRAAVRAAFEINKTAINACTTVEALAALVFSWPIDPNAPVVSAAE